MLTKSDYESAVLAQSASNLSGIVHSWSDLIGRIHEEARERGRSTDWVNRHPINRLFAEQVAHLTGAGTPSNTNSYYDAYNTVVDTIRRMDQE